MAAKFIVLLMLSFVVKLSGDTCFDVFNNESGLYPNYKIGCHKTLASLNDTKTFLTLTIIFLVIVIVLGTLLSIWIFREFEDRLPEEKPRFEVYPVQPKMTDIKTIKTTV